MSTWSVRRAGGGPIPPTNFSWVAQHLLCAFAKPYLPEHVEFLLRLPLHTLVTLSPEAQPPNQLKTMTQWFPMFVPVMRAPTIDQLERFLGIIENARRNELIVGIHCYAGKGRTGVFLCAYLMKFANMKPETSIRVLRQYRPGSLESQEQVDMVYTFYHAVLSDSSIPRAGQVLTSVQYKSSHSPRKVAKVQDGLPPRHGRAPSGNAQDLAQRSHRNSETCPKQKAYLCMRCFRYRIS